MSSQEPLTALYLSLFEGLFLKQYSCSWLDFSVSCFSIVLHLKELTQENARRLMRKRYLKAGKGCGPLCGSGLSVGTASWISHLEIEFQRPRAWESNQWLITPALLSPCPWGEAFEGCGFSSERAEQVPWEGSIAQTHSPAPFSLVLHTSMEGFSSESPCTSRSMGPAAPAASPGHCREPGSWGPWPALAAHLSLGCS